MTRPSEKHVSAPARIVLLLCVSVGVATVGLGIIWPLIPVYALEMGATGFQVGFMVACFNIARTVANPIAGRFSDRHGRKSFIATGLFLYAAVGLLYIHVNRVDLLILVRTFHGLTSVLVVPIAMALVADIVPDSHLGTYMGTLNMAIMLGLGAGPIMGGVIRDMLGMNAAFYIMGALALLTLLSILTFLPAGTAASDSQNRQAASPFTIQIRHRGVQGLFLMRFFVAAGQGSVYTFLPLLALEIDLTSSQVGIVLGANVFVIAFFQRMCGNLADRHNPLLLITGGTLVSGAAVIAMPMVTGFVNILILNILMGAANGFAMPAGFLLAGRMGRRLGMASVMGITDSGWSMGMTVSPILSGIILDRLGMPQVFLIGGLLITAGAILVHFFLRGAATEV